MMENIISISIPPFPDFIEGNMAVFRAGQIHPERKNLGYFDLIAVKKGCLYLAENENRYDIKANELFLLLPDGHHFSWKPCSEETEFYWIHFYTTAQWKQDSKPSHFVSNLPIPDHHYHQCSYTLHLPKHTVIKETKVLFDLIQEVLDSTVGGDIWKTEELFLRLLRFLENQGSHQDRMTQLAEQVHVYLEKHMGEKVTNQMLSQQFHLHSNYIARAMKATFGRTPLEVLLDIRMEYAKQYLIRSDYDLTMIARVVGFSSEIYFSNCFKKEMGISPQYYRKKYRIM